MFIICGDVGFLGKLSEAKNEFFRNPCRGASEEEVMNYLTFYYAWSINEVKFFIFKKVDNKSKTEVDHVPKQLFFGGFIRKIPESWVETNFDIF